MPTTTTTTAPTTTTTEPPTTTTTEAPIKWTGRGDDIIEIPAGPALLYIEYSGSSNFVVQSYTAEGDRIDVLVNEIGKYKGIKGYDFDESQTARLEITASGSWVVERRDLRTMRVVDAPGTLTGTGDEVFLV